jgi:hypothetical protein
VKSEYHGLGSLGGSAGLSNAIPQPLGIPAPGVGGAASRDDHVHQMPALGDLTNVSVPAPNNLDVLTYDNATSTWIAAPGGGGGGWPNVTGTDINGRVYEQALVATANTSLIITPTGTGAIQAQVADNTAAGGNARGNNAVDFQQVRSGATSVASGVRSFIGSGSANAATALETAVVSGSGNVATAQWATSLGTFCNATGTASFAAGNVNTASGVVSTVPGGNSGIADLYGMFTHASGRFALVGDAQFSRMVLRRVTLDGTPTQLTADGGAGSATTRVTIPNNTGFRFHVLVMARDTSGANSAWWDIRGGIIKNTTAGSTTLIGVNAVDNGATPGAAGWTVTATANTTNGALAITVTGALGVTIRWVAAVHLARVSY